MDIEKALIEAIHYVSIRHIDVAFNMLEGWWFKRVVYELLNNGQGITRFEFDSQISEIQESLKSDSLPIDDEIDKLMIALSELPEYANRPFYKQVELVGAGSGRICNAITSYLQAFRQRSAWMRDDLLFDTDLRSYDHRLGMGMKQVSQCDFLDTHDCPSFEDAQSSYCRYYFMLIP